MHTFKMKKGKLLDKFMFKICKHLCYSKKICLQFSTRKVK